MDALHFSDISEPRPTKAGLAEAYAGINVALDRGDRAAALADWDNLRFSRNLRAVLMSCGV
jgi:hypothetical protein